MSLSSRFCAKRFVASNSSSRPGSRPQKTRGNSRFGGSYLFSSPFNKVCCVACKASLSLSLSLSGGSVFYSKKNEAMQRHTSDDEYDSTKSLRAPVEYYSFEAEYGSLSSLFVIKKKKGEESKKGVLCLQM